ncbi:MAG: ADP,ATP carrier protein 1 [Candidatus Anoxychlamydiales bacterium]|nr:ADP,ATP carrier protein 1 [Candidatus Anoxychlamydiales bacterium]
MSTTFKFGKVRTFLWPIHSSELKKFIPMVLIFFLIAFNYNVLRAVKDTLVITAPSSGAEAIPFIKVWAILPMAFLMTYIFTKLSNKYSTEKVFYYMMGIFLGFFSLFTFILYPLRDLIHPYNLADQMQGALPQGFNGFIAMIRHWTLTSFYVMAELWGTAILTVCFWGFANEVTTVHEAKRFYSLFGVGANIAGILSGEVAVLLSSKRFFSFVPYGKDAWEQSVLFMNLTVLITGILIIALFRYINKKAINVDEPTISQVKKPREKISLKKSFSYLARSKYLLFIALIVLSYNLTTHIVEVVWKNQVKSLCPNPQDFNAYMGHVMIYTGLVATPVALFLSGNFLRKFSWAFSALITPLVVLITGACFFTFFLYRDTPSALRLASFFGSTPLVLSVFFGTMQNTLSRASKYTLFDATKEIAFIPLDKSSRRKGKAAIDGVGSRLGKSSGSIITQGFIIIFATLSASAPYIAFLFLIILGVWLISVVALGKRFNSLMSHKEKITLQEVPMQTTDKLSEKELKKYFPFAEANKKDKVKK